VGALARHSFRAIGTQHRLDLVAQPERSCLADYHRLVVREHRRKHDRRRVVPCHDQSIMGVVPRCRVILRPAGDIYHPRHRKRPDRDTLEAEGAAVSALPHRRNHLR
jgi:hypothetical protein